MANAVFPRNWKAQNAEKIVGQITLIDFMHNVYIIVCNVL